MNSFDRDGYGYRIILWASFVITALVIGSGLIMRKTTFWAVSIAVVLLLYFVAFISLRETWIPTEAKKLAAQERLRGNDSLFNLYYFNASDTEDMTAFYIFRPMIFIEETFVWSKVMFGNADRAKYRLPSRD